MQSMNPEISVAIKKLIENGWKYAYSSPKPNPQFFPNEKRYGYGYRKDGVTFWLNSETLPLLEEYVLS